MWVYYCGWHLDGWKHIIVRYYPNFDGPMTCNESVWLIPGTEEE